MIDSHVHLNNLQYKDDLEQVVATAKACGVEKVVLIGCGPEEGVEVLRMKDEDPDFYNIAIGYHPVDISNYSDAFLKQLEEWIRAGRLIAIGEIGLDYYWHPEEKEQQIIAFKKQLDLAKKYNLPVIIHGRDSYEDCYEVLREYAPIKGIMHSYAGDSNYAQKFIDLGLEIGLSGPITFKNGHSQKEVAQTIDLQYLHIETDGPYLTPVPFRGKRNRPEYILYVAEEIAFQKKISVEEVLTKTSENSKKLFNI